jgi:dTDP-4-amino-4,6-dideoxygalactose transaminase
VIEDAAQAHGAGYKGRRCGSMGDAGCFSFYFTKNLGALGEGGFVALRDGELAERVRLLRHHGHVSKFEHAVVGHNLRLDEIQAAVLRVKLRHLDAQIERRRALARRYDALLADCPVRTLGWRGDGEPAPHVYPIRVSLRDELRAHLDEQGIATGIHYPIPAHRQTALRDRPHRHRAMVVTEHACAQLLSLPFYPELTDEQVEYVVGGVRSFFARVGGAATRCA